MLLSNLFSSRFVVHLDRASELPHKGRRRTYDTIVKLNIMSMPKQKSSSRNSSRRNSTASNTSSNSVYSVQCSRKVKTNNNTPNPHFHEDFYFPVEKLKWLKSKLLRLSLYDADRQGRHDAIGHALLPLSCHIKIDESLKHEMELKCSSMVKMRNKR